MSTGRAGPVPAPSPRRLALRVLREIERRHGFSNRILAEALQRRPDLASRDRGLATTLVYGVLRHRTRLDRHIDRVATRPEKLKGELRELLRLGTYELRELQRPLGVAADECVRLARHLDPRGALTGLITAVLAGVDGGGRELDAELDAAAPLDAIEGRWSIPRWLAGRWIKQLGPEVARARAIALADPPFVDLRLDLSRTSRDDVAATLVEHTPGAVLELPDEQPQCIRVRAGANLTRHAMYERGLFSVQGMGSQQAARLLAPEPGERILDACAGMGGKTLHLAECMHRRGSIVAVDAQASQLHHMSALRTRGQLDGGELALAVVQGDLNDPALDLGVDPLFDRVLLDAPCSGLGNLGRHPELRWTSRHADIEICADRQGALLRAAALRLRPGGRLVYSVCSLEPEEGARLVEAAAGGHELGPGITIVTQQSWTPESHATDGFYLALLCRS